MLKFESDDGVTKVCVTVQEQDSSWDAVLRDIVVFLHACGYVFIEADVLEEANALKSELQEAEEGVPF
jgi:hypothetical protein